MSTRVSKFPFLMGTFLVAATLYFPQPASAANDPFQLPEDMAISAITGENSKTTITISGDALSAKLQSVASPAENAIAVSKETGKSVQPEAEKAASETPTAEEKKADEQPKSTPASKEVDKPIQPEAEKAASEAPTAEEKKADEQPKSAPASKEADKPVQPEAEKAASEAPKVEEKKADEQPKSAPASKEADKPVQPEAEKAASETPKIEEKKADGSKENVSASVLRQVTVTAKGKNKDTAITNAGVAAIRIILKEHTSIDFMKKYNKNIRKYIILNNKEFVSNVNVIESINKNGIINIKADVDVDEKKILNKIEEIRASK